MVHLFTVEEALLCMPVPEQFEEKFWERHSNPKSGWSRVLVIPVLLYAVYQRNWRLAAAAIVFTVVNPFLFSPPKDDRAWMTRIVRAEQWWTDKQGESVLGLSYPNVLNLLNIPATGYAFVSAYRKKPIQAVIGGVASISLKFWYVGALVRRYDTEKVQQS